MDEAEPPEGGRLHPPVRARLVDMLPEGRNLGITLSTETTVTIQSILYTNTRHALSGYPFHLVARRRTAPYITSRLAPRSP